MSKSGRKMLLKLFDLCIKATTVSKYSINYDYAGTCERYSVFAYSKKDEEQIPIAVCEEISFKNLKNTRRKILKMMEEK
ncbi:hypothetical protein [uncultured Clostridium sp.]|uniref:hypothetical protein n=1 Tax=uncultured Clostridium sp. TaxID=59620 RepID=UPI0025FDBDCA|nr:hypothetical protein [uncultured Clostridium sp.]